MSSILLVAFLSGIYLLNPHAVQFLNFKSTDIIMGTTETPGLDPEVVIVDIDDASLKKFGQWPWPRYRLAQLLQQLKKAEASAVGVSIIFPEQDRTSPKIWQENLKKNFGYVIDTSNIPPDILDNDAFLANTLAAGPFILGYEFLFDQPGTLAPLCELKSISLARKGMGDSQPVPLEFHRADGALCNYQILGAAVNRSGFLNGTSDTDGVLRRLPLLIEFEGHFYPSFALAVLMKYRQQSSLLLQNENSLIFRLSLGDLHIPVDNHGNYFLGPPRRQESSYFSAVDLIEGKVSSEKFKGKIVLVGLSASGLDRIFPTPMDPATSHLELHKYSIESLATSLHTIRVPVFSIIEVLISLSLCLFLALCITHMAAAWSVGFCFFTAMLCWIVAGVVYQSSGYLFSPFLPTVSVLLNCGLLTNLKFHHFQIEAKSETGNTLLLLESSETSLQAVLNTIPDIVYRLNPKGEIIFISPAISKYFKSAEDLLGSSIFELVAPEDIDRAKNRLNEKRTGDRASHNLEIRMMLTKESSQSREKMRYFSISAEGVYQGNSTGPMDFLGTQGIIKDITERKRLEYQLLQAQNMEVVGNLAAGIAHDLNNILSGLVSYPDLLLLEIPEDSPLCEKVAIIQRSGKKAAAIVQDLLTLARRNIDINEVCNMNVILSEYLESMEFQHVRNNYPEIVIQTGMQDGLLNVKGSAVHLAKLIVIILHNAFEAMVAGGNVMVSTQNTYIDSFLDGYEHIPEGEYVCITVSDNGVGIPQDDLARVFEPFYAKRSMGRSGTGLGMTVIWATVKDHDGYLDIESQEGHGTTLKIYLPATRDLADSRPPRVTYDNYTGTETVLVVDDIMDQLDISRNMLLKLGYRVLTATSGREAILAVQRQPVDLIVLDMIMPGGFDGLETYQRIERLYPHQKAIITSGYSETERVKKLQQLGVVSYVQKPYTMETLGIAVRTELDR